MSNEKARIMREFLRQEKKVKPELSKKTARSFNFAACMLPVIYNCVYNRIPLAILFLVLTAIPHIIDTHVNSGTYISVVIFVSVASVLLAVYSGITGNKKAYDARDYDDERDFIFSQRGWKIAAVIALIIHLLIINRQINGHYNVAQMIDFSKAKVELKEAIQKGAEDEYILGSNVLDDKVPLFFGKYIEGDFNEETGVINAKSGYKYTVEGYNIECISRYKVNYHEDLTACGKVTVDINGKEGPNKPAVLNGVNGVKPVSRGAVKLNDLFTLYVYNDDLAPKEGSVEEYALRKYEKE